MGIEKIIKALKRCNKRKNSITMGVVIAFLLGNISSYGEIYDEITVGTDSSGNIIFTVTNLDEPDESIKIEYDKIGYDFNKREWTISDDTIINGQINIDSSIFAGVDVDLSKIINENGKINLDKAIKWNGKKFTIINNGVISVNGAREHGIYSHSDTNISVIDKVINNGNIFANRNGIYSYSNSSISTSTNTSIIGEISNNGVISAGKNGSGIYSYSESGINTSVIGKVMNNGVISADESFGNGILSKSYSKSGTNISTSVISEVTNTGVISADKGYGNGILSSSNNSNINTSVIGKVMNNGIISASETLGVGISSSSGSSSNSELGTNISAIGEITNNGVIFAGNYGIYSTSFSNSKSGTITLIIEEVTNNGIIFAEKNGIYLYSKSSSGINTSVIGEIMNNGVISAGNYGIYSNSDFLFNPDSELNSSSATIEKIINSGIIMGKDTAIKLNSKNESKINSYNNYGIIAGKNLINLIGNTTTINGDNFDTFNDKKFADKGIAIKFSDNNGTVGTVYSGAGGEYEINSSFKYIVNSLKENQNGYDKNTAESTVIKSSELANKIEIEKYKNNGFKDLILNGVDKTLFVNKDIKISDSIINAYKTAVHIESDKTFTGENITFNGGVDGETAVITGDSGNNNLVLSGKTQLNGDIDLKEGEDKIFFEKSAKKESGTSESNVNLFHKISGAEEIVFNTDVTLFEKAEVNGAENIYIGENGNLILRIDGTNNNSHALLNNNGTITSNGGKLLLALNGVGEGEIISFGENILDETMVGNEIGYTKDITLDTTSYLHKISKNQDNKSVTVKTVENLPEINKPDNLEYDKLNKIYQSIRSSNQVGEFNVTDEKTLSAFTKYLHDIYAGNPYAYSSELSRKTMGMMRNLADKDLHPELNKWAIYGGFTHVDGGTEESYYGKGYYTYDIGSRDIEADTKITGGYFKAEYGKSENITTGIIFGGNNSQTEILNSKVEGDSFYFGAYAKKFINDFRFTLGAGFQHGDYKADRTAVGYEGITTTRSYNDNYHDRGFDIYGNIKYSKEIGNNLYFEPSFTLSYTYVDQDGASENGILSMETDSKYFDYSSAEINLDVRKEFIFDKLTHSLTAGISYERMLSGYDEEFITGRFKNGSDFDILVPEKEKDIFALNTKYELETEKGFMFDVKASYRFENGNDKSEWTLGAGAGYKF